MASGARDGFGEAGLMLIVLADEGATAYRVPLEGDGPVFIGSGAEAKLKIDVPGVSDLHAKIVRTPGGWRVRDLGSFRGTRVNGMPIDDSPLKPGDEIGIGQAIIRIEGARRSRVRVVLAPSSPAIPVVGEAPSPGDPAPAASAAPPMSTAPLMSAAPAAADAPLRSWTPTMDGASTVAVRLESLELDVPTVYERLAPGRPPLDRRIARLWLAARVFAHVRRRGHLLERALALLVDLLAPDRAYVMRPPDAGEAEFERELGAGPRLDSGALPSRTIVRQAADARSAVLILDTTTDQKASEASSVATQGIRSVVCAPLLRAGKAIAVLYADRLGGRPFDGEDLCLLGLLASHAAAQLENLSLVEELERWNRELETKVEERSAEVRRQAEQIRAIAADKDELMGIVAHDVRGLLTGVSGYVDLLREDLNGLAERSRVVDDIREDASKAASACGDLLRLVDDLLDAKQAEAGKIRIDPRPVPVADLIDRVVMVTEFRARSRGIGIDVDADRTLLALADPGRVQQALVNLMINAIKFSPRDGRVRVIAAGGDPSTVRIDVVDHGPGIAPEELKDLFKRFEQGAAGRAQKGGSGLGLSIAKKLIELNGGRIEVASVQGFGSRFSVSLPRAV